MTTSDNFNERHELLRSIISKLGNTGFRYVNVKGWHMITTSRGGVVLCLDNDLVLIDVCLTHYRTLSRFINLPRNSYEQFKRFPESKSDSEK